MLIYSIDRMSVIPNSRAHWYHGLKYPVYPDVLGCISIDQETNSGALGVCLARGINQVGFLAQNRIGDSTEDQHSYAGFLGEIS